MSSHEPTVGGIVDTLIFLKDKHRSHLLQHEIDALNYACNILDKHFNPQDSAYDVAYNTEGGE